MQSVYCKLPLKIIFVKRFFVIILAAMVANGRRTPAKQTVGTVKASQKMLTMQALSSSFNAGAAKGGCLG